MSLSTVSYTVDDVVMAAPTLSMLAVERFRDLVRPRMTAAAARADLEQTLAAGGARITACPPSWAGRGRPMDAYLLLDADVVLPLLWSARKGWIAVTCLVRGEVRAWGRRT